MSAETMTPIPRASQPWLKTFYWSMRRELWEHRSIYLAPAAAAAVVLVGYLISLAGLPHALKATVTAHKASAMSGVGVSYMLSSAAVSFMGLIVAVLYCANALHGERRDRTLLFWKSLPVSNLTTVASKAALPLVVTPVAQIALSMATHLVMLILAIPVVVFSGSDLHVFWSRVPLLQVWFELGRGLPVLTLWYAPIYAWLIMVSAWAKRLPILWGVAPPLAVALVEKLAFNSTAVWTWLRLRVDGPFTAAATKSTPGHPAPPNPADLTNPHLWVGVAAAVLFLAVAVRLRRSSEPI
jgi:ABC-2 type transport system permease protein